MTVSLAQTVLDLRCLAEDFGQLQPPTIIETDSQSVFLTARDFSGKTLFLRHRRRQLAFLMACSKALLIELRLTPAIDQTADHLSKPHGPLEHWRGVPFLQGSSPAVLHFKNLVENQYGGRKKVFAQVSPSSQDPSLGLSSVVAPMEVHKSTHGTGYHGIRKAARSLLFPPGSYNPFNG